MDERQAILDSWTPRHDTAEFIQLSRHEGALRSLGVKVVQYPGCLSLRWTEEDFDFESMVYDSGIGFKGSDRYVAVSLIFGRLRYFASDYLDREAEFGFIDCSKLYQFVVAFTIENLPLQEIAVDREKRFTFPE